MADEISSLQELEVRLKEQEIKLKEVETRAKEREIASSKWLSPLVIAVLVAALGLIGNLLVTAINNANSQELERSRTQSTLVLEAIKTNGDTNAACRNLIFLTSLGLIEDRNQTITGACPGNVRGVPSVQSGPPDWALGLSWYPLRVQIVDNRDAPIPDVTVEANLIPRDFPIPPGVGPDLDDLSDYLGIFGRTGRCTTGKAGSCFLGMAPAGKFVAVLAKKNGYIGNRTNTFFTGTSVVVVLQKTSPIR